MSRIGRLPIELPAGVTVAIDGNVVTVKGPLGSLEQIIRNNAISVELAGNVLHVKRSNEEKTTKAAHGLYRALLHNMVVGVSKGYTRSLVYSGVGYKAAIQGADLVLNLGYSHPITVVAPEGIKLAVAATGNEITVTGIDKTVVGQCAANIKALRKPEPYHGYGIHYKEEVILRKVGKASGK